MPASQSKISFDAINIVRAENIYLTESKKDRNVKRKMLTTDGIIREKKILVADSLDLRPSTKQKNSTKTNTREQKLKNTSSVVTAAKKSRKRQLDIGNAYSKLNAQVKNPSKSNGDHPKSVLAEKSDSRSSFYETPRQDIPITDIDFDFENMNPNHLPENFHECELDEFIRCQYPDFDDFPEYDFQEPFNFENFDIPRPNKSNLRHFKELLDREELSQNKLLQKSEIELLKDIVKADERYQKLKRDDYQLLKEILLGQLKEISEQERVIKIALEKVRRGWNQELEVDNLKVVKPEQPLENDHRTTKTNRASLGNKSISTHKKNCGISAVNGQEVDVFFKNVPTLEKEIRILKLLGRKLEETLKKPTETTPTKSPQVLLTTQCLSFKHSIRMASSRVFSFASKSILGIVREFKISHQTISELKLERDFYIATDLDNFTLQRTNFDSLRHNPELLLRRLKPFKKDARLKFNFIEQDPMFFNHFLANICKISSKTFPSGHGTYIPENQCFEVSNQKRNVIPAIEMNDRGDGAGDHCDLISKDGDTKQELEMEKTISRTVIGKNKYKQRQRRLLRTPMPETKAVSVKNSLLKTILLGLLHLTISLVVLTAIFYPDVICF